MLCHIKGGEKRIPETVHYNGMPFTDPARKVELFNQFFVQYILFLLSREVIPL